MTRLLQTLVSSVAGPPPQLPVQLTPGPVDKVLNWDTTGTGMVRPDLSTLSHRSRSFSRDRYDQPQPLVRTRRSPSYHSGQFRRRSRPRRRSRSRSRAPEPRRDFPGPERSGRHRSPRSPRCRPRHSPRHRERERRDWSPLTKYFPSPGREMCERDRGRKRTLHRSDHRRSSHRETSHTHSSPKRKRCHEERKIVPSPQRSQKSIRDIINDERDARPREKPVKKLAAKKTVKDRLGTKPAAITEIFNMDPAEGQSVTVSSILY